MKKITGKEGGSQKIATTIVNIRKSWHAIISWHAVQPPLSGHSHLLAIPRRVFFQLSPLLSSCASSAWYTYFGFVSRIRWRKVQSKKDVDAYGPMGSASCMALEWLGCNDSHNYQAAVSLHFVLFCFLFACCFVTCPWLERHVKGFSTETTFRSITFFAKIVWSCWVCLGFV